MTSALPTGRLSSQDSGYKSVMDISRSCSVSFRFMPLSRQLCLLLTILIVPTFVRGNADANAVRLLLNAKTEEELNEAVAKARSSELPQQVVIEARMLYGIRNQDKRLLRNLLPDMVGLTGNFSASSSIAGMTSVEQLRGMIAYIKALDAMDEHDEPGFRSQITEAFWNFPQQAELFGQTVEQFQLNDKMQRWALDFTIPLLESGGKETTLGSVIGSQKVMILVFWSSKNQASISALRSLPVIAGALKPHNIPLACVNIDHSEAEEEAEKLRAELKPTVPWLIESNERVLTAQIEVSSLPRAVVITQQGRVVFHGHPLDVELWRVLKRYAPTIKPPVARN